MWNIWYDKIWYDIIWYMIWYIWDMIYDMIWHIWYGLISYDMIYDMIWYYMIYHMIWFHIWYRGNLTKNNFVICLAQSFYKIISGLNIYHHPMAPGKQDQSGKWIWAKFSSIFCTNRLGKCIILKVGQVKMWDPSNPACLFSLLRKTTSLKRTTNSGVALDRYHCIMSNDSWKM